MKKKITLLFALLVAFLPLKAQTPPSSIEMYVKEGATDVAIYVKGNGDITVDWGDGNQETITLNSSYALGTELSHTYATATTEKTTVTIGSSGVTAITSHYSDHGAIVGFGTLDAPDLESFEFASYSGSTLRESKDGVMDFSKCPKLTSIDIKNAPGIKLGEHPNLNTIRIISGADDTKPDYAEVSNEKLDLSKYPELQIIYIFYQKSLKEIDFTGLNKLTELRAQNCGLTSAPGLREATKNPALVKLNISGHLIPLNQIPDKNPAVTYSEFKINYPYTGYVIPENKVQGLTIDLSEMAKEYDFNGNEYKPSFVWRVEGEYMDIPAESYTEENGVFTFTEEFLEENDEKSVYARITPSYFSLQDLAGSTLFPIETAPVTIKKEAPQGVISFTTTKNVGEKIRIGIMFDGSVEAEGIVGELKKSASVVYEYELSSQTVTIKGNVQTLQINSQKIVDVDVTGCPTLEGLVCGSNQLTELNLSGLKNLKSVSAQANAIKTVDLSGCTGLISLVIEDNLLETIDLSSNSNLALLRILRNRLETIDLSSNRVLLEVYLSGNELKTVDFSNNVNLTVVNILDNDINGTRMDDLIASLPMREEADKAWIGVIGNETDHPDEKNVCTVDQVKALKAKNWTAKQYKQTGWASYNGSPLVGIEDVVEETKVIVARYTLNGEAINKPVEGVNIVIYSDGTTGKEMVTARDF